MILGTFHFGQIRDRFKPGMVEGLLRRLQAFKPDAIAVEGMPGSLIRDLEGHDAEIDRELLASFAGDRLELGHAAQKVLGISSVQAAATLAKGWVAPVDGQAWAQRALLCLAAYDLPDAVLAWHHVGDARYRRVLPQDLAVKLDASAAKVNEVQALAVPLAMRLGLDRIASVDEFEDTEAWPAVESGLESPDFRNAPAVKAVAKAAVYEQARLRLEAAVAAGDLLPALQGLNAPDCVAQDVDAQWGVFLRTHLSGGADRGRLALWENRNFRIASRIRALTAAYPGKRILVIYGAAHKPFLEAYLGQCSDLDIVACSAWL
jgi:hypothetical protein